MKEIQAEKLLGAWVTLSGIIKNSRITKGLQYNEAIVMNVIYNRYTEDGEGRVSIKEITAKTRMIKSLVNRTVNSLIKKGFLIRSESEGDKRVVYVKCVQEKVDTFLKVHGGSIKIANSIIEILGDEDTQAFIRIVDKIEKSGYSPA
ncbi:MAG: MarR family transcriptional regulator [Clostridia bacterium]|nr:MarR family transcriptional regulator [Clostridia bacterium]